MAGSPAASPAMAWRAVLPWLAGLAAATALFLAFPGLDLWTSGLFYRPGEGFFLGRTAPVRLIYAAVPWIVEATLALLALATLVALRRGRPLLGLDRRAIVFLLAALVAAPGLLVNTALKDHWGRARPVQTTVFGGTREFTPAPLPADQCRRNCSFVAGHPAMGFYLVAFALLAPPRRRRAAIAAAVAFGALVGVVRIAQGGHFLSDVVFAGLLVCGTCRLLHWGLVGRDLLSPERIRRAAAALGGTGRALVLGALLTAAVATLSWSYLDRPLALYLHAQGLDRIVLFQAVTRLGVSTGYLVATALLFLGLRLAAWRAAPPWDRRLAAHAWLPGFVFLAVAVSGLAADLLKILLGRARPRLLFRSDHFGFDFWATRADFWSFPSGHATTAVALAMAFWCLWPRRHLAPLYAAFALAVSASRVLIGAHYLSDVFVGAFLGIAVTLYIRAVLARSGIDLAEARAGALMARPLPSWRARLGLAPLAPPPLSDTL